MSDNKRLDWNEYFMSIAKLTSVRSSCNRLQVGCVIVKDKHVVSMGYNGFLPSFPHESIYGLKLNEVLPINNNDFFLYPYSLSDISEREEQITGIDYRRNHLAKHNHEILYTNINKFLNGHSNYTEHLIKSGSNDFIYE